VPVHGFSTTATALLRRAGWAEGYATDPAEAARACRIPPRNRGPRGFGPPRRDFEVPFFPEVERFLRRFGGLRFANPAARPKAAQDWHFDAVHAITFYAHDARRVATRLDVPACPIGQANQDYVLLLMAEDGQVYGTMDHYLWLIGRSGVDAVESLCAGRDWIEVDGDTDQDDTGR
jgi:SUKH-3 immunity protein of toxin-antitoxin system